MRPMTEHPDFRKPLDRDGLAAMFEPPAPSTHVAGSAPSLREWFELANLAAEGIHQASRALHSIARDLSGIRAKLDALAPVAEGLARGGRLGAWSAARASRKDGKDPDQ